METNDIKMDIEEENKNENNINKEYIKQDITAGELYSKLQIFSFNFSLFLSKKGGFPLSIIYRINPQDQTSHFSV